MKIKNLSKGQEDFFIITIEKEEMQEINILVDGGKSGSRCVKETIEAAKAQGYEAIILIAIIFKDY